MSRLLKYSTVLALAAAIGGGYMVLGPPSDGDIVPDTAQREHIEPAPPRTPASIDEEIDYLVAGRVASLEG
jgi:hypothetical protein